MLLLFETGPYCYKRCISVSGFDICTNPDLRENFTRTIQKKERDQIRTLAVKGSRAKISP